MSRSTIRLPDEKHQRLKALSRHRGASMNRLISDVITLFLAESDAEVRFQIRARRGHDNGVRGIALLRRAKDE